MERLRKKINVYDILSGGKLQGALLKVFVICLLIGICDGYCMYIFGVTGVTIQEELGFTAVQQGLINSYATWGMTAATALVGLLADKIGRKRVLIASVLIYSVFTALTGFATEMWQFAIVRFVSGIGMAGIVPVGVATTSEYSPLQNRALLCSLVAMGVSLGMLLAGLAALWVLPVVSSWRVLYYVAFLPLILAVAALSLPESMKIWVQDGKREQIEKTLVSANPEFKPDPEVEYVADSGVHIQRAPWTQIFAKGVLRNTLCIWVMYFCNMCIVYGAGTWLPGIMRGAGYAVSSGILLFVVFSIGSMIFTPVAGKLVQKFGYKKVMAVQYALTALTLCLFGISKSMAFSTVMIFLAGGASNSIQTVIQPFAGHFYPLDIRTTGISWGVTMGRLGSAVAPIALGFLVAANISLQINFLAVACFAVIGGMAMLMTKDVNGDM